jgi:acetyltransferase-like isoleucine patch superfamily enzyme
VEIGRAARIAGQVTIGAGTRIGAHALIHPGARIGRNVAIGDRFICQPGAVIGSDGFSYVTPEKSGAEEVRKTLGQQAEIRKQKWLRIHTLGGVEIGDDVEIGSNATVDAGTIRATVIGNGLFVISAGIESLAVATVLAAMFPATTVLLAWLVLRERLTPRRMAGLALALVAVGLVAAG